MRILIIGSILCWFCLAKDNVPIIVTPPVLRLNSTNTIFITPLHRVNGPADIKVKVHELLQNGNYQTEYRHAKGKISGHAHPVSFKVNNDAIEANLTVTVSGHVEQQIRLLVAPDLRTIYLKTDKGFYKAGETINLRSVPITINGEIYVGQIEYALVNPDGFELTKHVVSAPNTPLSLTFDLPEHLFYGEWQIKARPINSQNQPLLNFAVSFQVTDYALPPFVLDFQILDGDSMTETKLTANAHYFHGGLVSGSVTLNCFDPDSQTPHEKQLHQPLLVGEVGGFDI
ncbi:unnamed protein product, partial [Mesorhabditis belari]|uniref:MG2 domain-containing protein n=1 Tax=Mesorhabditis belari TaxID=2138241 RepID=A0AAF3FK10_9BILA